MWLNSANKIFFFLNKFIVVYLIIIMVDYYQDAQKNQKILFIVKK